MRKFGLVRTIIYAAGIAVGVKVGIHIGSRIDNGISHIAGKISKCADSIKKEFSN